MDLLVRDGMRVSEKGVRVLERAETIPEREREREREFYAIKKRKRKIALAHEQYSVSIPSTVS
jgi:hypothetical protein